MTGKALLVLAALGGGAVYLYSKKSKDCGPGMHRMPDGSCMRDELMPSGTYDVLDPEMVALYQSIIYGHGTPNDCKTLLEYIDHLTPESSAEETWLAQVRADVVQACEAGPVPVASNPPALPSWIPDQLVTSFGYCWNVVDLSKCDPESIINPMLSIIQNYQGMVPSEQTNQAYQAISDLRDRYTAVAGLPHVGDCGCAECAAKRIGHEEDEPCCEACALGVGSCACQQQGQGAKMPAPYAVYPNHYPTPYAVYPTHTPNPQPEVVDYGSVRGA